MWKLTIEDDEGKQTQLPLAHEEYGLGRAESNTIRLTDRNVSRNHASLKLNGQGWLVKDLQSYNGTYINGVRVVGEQVIHSGDIVQLGDYRLELVDEGALAQAAAQGQPVVPALPPVHQRPNRLVVVVGPTPGAEYPLDKDHFTIGRSEDATISINHSSVSRVHAELFPLGNGRFEIVDKASANGIRINGVELKRGILEAGDALELGDVRLRFIGAGKIFRTDMSGLAGGFGGVATPTGIGTGTNPMVRVIGVGAAVALAVILGIVALVSVSGAKTTGTGKAKVALTKESLKQLDDAIALLDKKDYNGAHNRLLEIPEEQRDTDNQKFKDVETAWAEWKFGLVDKATDSKAKKLILKEIASTETVDAKQRIKAGDMIREIDAKEPPPPVPTFQPGAGSFGTGAGAVPTVKTADPPTVMTGIPAQGPPNEEQLRKQLEPRVWSGKASIGDIKMLKAICSHLGDHACRNRAAAMLQKKLDESN